MAAEIGENPHCDACSAKIMEEELSSKGPEDNVGQILPDRPKRYIASMVLSGVGDAMGYYRGRWEFMQSGSQIQDELEKLGGLKTLDIKPPHWIVSDDTVMHLATADALVEYGSQLNKENLYKLLAEHYKKCMTDMDHRSPGRTCMISVGRLRPNDKKGYEIPFDMRHTGCGAAMRAMCIGLRYPRPEDLPDLIAVSIEAGRMTHNCPRGFLGSLTAALFTHYAIQGKKVREWGAGLMDVLKDADTYITESGRDVSENKEHWPQFVSSWKQFLKDRRIADGKSEPVYEANFDDVDNRHRYYQKFSASGWPGDSGHDAPLIAYDALLAAGDSWSELCRRAMLHGGDNDSTGAIAGAWFGALYGFHGVPQCHYKKLEYRDRMKNLGNQLAQLVSPSDTTHEGNDNTAL